MTWKRVILGIVLLVALLSCNVAGSRISLTASSPSIQPLLTPSLNLRCALEDTDSSAALIGRRVATTLDNVNYVKFITSMFVFRNGADIASLSEHVPARAVSNTPNLNVTGHIPGNQGERGVIELSMKYPSDTQGGNYTCQVSAVDDVGHFVVYSASIDIDVTTPTINDLVQHINSQDIRGDTLESKVDDLQLKDKNTQARIHSQDLEIVSLKAEVQSLKADVDIIRHVEVGVVDCGRLGNGSPTLSSKSVTFKTPYSSAPRVNLAVLDIDTHKDFHAYFDVKLVNTKPNGFTVQCGVPYNDHLIDDLRISWISFP